MDDLDTHSYCVNGLQIILYYATNKEANENQLNFMPYKHMIMCGQRTIYGTHAC